MGKVIVTGGAGFIGSHVVDRLLDGGYEVHVVDNLSSGKKENIAPNAHFHERDITDPELGTLLKEIAPDTIVHCAAQISVRTSMEDPVTDSRINIGGLINILQGVRDPVFGGKPPFFVFISTGGAIYGEQETFPANESHPIQPESVYGLAKRTGEMYLDLWRRQFGLSYAALRLSNVYGPRQNPHGEAGVVAIFNQKLLEKQVPTINGEGDQTRDFVFVKDVARAVTSVCAARQEGIFNIGTGKETSILELYELVTQAIGVTTRPTFSPAKGGEQMRSVIDASLAKEKFEWAPQVLLADGLKQTASWFAERM